MGQRSRSHHSRALPGLGMALQWSWNCLGVCLGGIVTGLKSNLGMGLGGSHGPCREKVAKPWLEAGTGLHLASSGLRSKPANPSLRPETFC